MSCDILKEGRCVKDYGIWDMGQLATRRYGMRKEYVRECSGPESDHNESLGREKCQRIYGATEE